MSAVQQVSLLLVSFAVMVLSITQLTLVLRARWKRIGTPITPITTPRIWFSEFAAARKARRRAAASARAQRDGSGR